MCEILDEIWTFLEVLVSVNSSFNWTPCFLSLYRQVEVGRITVCDSSGCCLECLWDPTSFILFGIIRVALTTGN